MTNKIIWRGHVATTLQSYIFEIFYFWYIYLSKFWILDPLYNLNYYLLSFFLINNQFFSQLLGQPNTKKFYLLYLTSYIFYYLYNNFKNLFFYID